MPEDILVKLGRHIKISRENRNMTQQALSDISGIAVRTISKIERGKMNPSYEILSILVRFLGISFDSLFSSTNQTIESNIQEIAVLYRNSSGEGQRAILASARAIALELKNTGKSE